MKYPQSSRDYGDAGWDTFKCARKKNLDTSWYQVSELTDIEFHWEYRDLNMDALSRPGIHTPFSPSTFNNFKMGSMAEDPILIDEEQDKENSAPLPTTPFSERRTQPAVMMRNCPFGEEIENVPIYAYTGLLTCFILCSFFIKN